MSSHRSTLRDLRLAAASNLLSTSNLSNRKIGYNNTSIRNYSSVPKPTLNLSTAKSRTWSAEKNKNNFIKKETKRERKRREWLLRKETNRYDEKKAIKNEEQSPWIYLPDVVLEEIFKMLPYDVSY